jgi:outer membrane protein OmpA-like peptidoglycan-associated protein
MDSGLVTVNANALAEGLDRDGHIAVYAILFDTGRATLRPESDAALREIAALLRNRPSLRLHVVGHTDSTGNFDSNMQLSVGRAQAVVAALVSSHGVAAVRLRAHGVGPLTPVATNATEDGKQLNRRVELVAQN